MATEYKLSYTASEIDEKLGMVNSMVKSVNGVEPDESGNVVIEVGSSETDIELDTTLTIEGKAADAKAVGDALNKKISSSELSSAINIALIQAKESGEFDGENGVSPTITTSKVSGVTTITITDAEGTKTATINDGQNCSGSSTSDNELPDYYYDNSYITNKILEIKELMDEAGNDGVSFAIFSDSHMGNNNGGNSGKIIYKVLNECDIPLVVSLGDVNSSSPQNTEDACVDTLEQFNEMTKSLKGKLVQVLGNHDGAWSDITVDINDDGTEDSYIYNITRQKLFNRTMQKNRQYPMVKSFGSDGTYFYIDDISSKTRFICLNTSDKPYKVDADGICQEPYNTMKGFAIRQEQVDWLIESLKITEDGWNVVLFSHATLHIVPDSGTIIRNILKAYNNKTTYSGSYAGTAKYLDEDTGTYIDALNVDVDFTNYKGNFIAQFAGHAHNDYYYKKDSQLINMLTIACDGRISNCNYFKYDSPYLKRALGTIYEQCVDVVVINKATKTINMVRIGAGENRKLDYESGVATYKVINNLTNVTTSNSATTVTGYGEYTTTVAPVSGYNMSSVIVTKNGEDVTSSAYNSETGTISIGSATGAIVVTATAVESGTSDIYSITNSLTGCTSNNNATTIETGSSYSATITASAGCEVSSIKVTMGGTDITSTAVSGNDIYISSVTGDVVIVASATVIPDVTTYSITNNIIEDCSTNNTATSIEEGNSYSATIMPNDNCEVSSIKVTMGGTDITSTAVSGNDIYISSVTGDVVITAIGIEITEYTNWLRKSLENDGATIYNDGVGYKLGYRISSSGENSAMSGADFTSYVTGFIPCKSGDTIRLKDVLIDPDNDKAGAVNIVYYDSTFTKILGAPWSGFATTAAGLYTSCTTDDSGNITSFVTSTAHSNSGNIAYIRLTVGDVITSSVITVNEEIEHSTETSIYVVTNNLTNCIASNNVSNVNENEGYSTTISANDGYSLDEVTVTMGGIDITSDVYTDGVVSISNVTGNIVITASAIEIEAGGYTNLIPLSTSSIDSTNIFNDTGYQDGKYVSGSNLGSDANFVVSGYIPYDSNTKPTIYMKGVTFDTSLSHTRIAWVRPDGTHSVTSGASGWSSYFTIEELGTQYYKLTHTGVDTQVAATHIRLSVKGTGANWILTLDEPIE